MAAATSSPPSPSHSSSPPSSNTSPIADTPADVSATAIPNASKITNTPRSHTIDIVEHRIDSGFKSIRSFTRRNRKADHLSLQDWNPPDRPYREYVRQLVDAGWISLRELEDYMGQPAQHDPEFMITVLDISHDTKTTRHRDLHNERELKEFMDTHNRINSKVRLYVAEYQDWPSPMLIETLGAGLKLDPRFFQWCTHSKGHDFRPSQRHRAPYISLGFGILDSSRPGTTDADQFKVMIYIQPDESGSGWTGTFWLERRLLILLTRTPGVILSNSHRTIDISPRILTDPPPFKSQIPPGNKHCPLSLREFYIKSLEFVSLADVIVSPFYAVSNIFRLNCFCWNEVITAVRLEDRLIKGISDTSIGHGEEINKAFNIVKRGGSYGWQGQDEPCAKETHEALIEDFQHLADQTELLWKNREKMASIKQRNSDARWTTLTNAFTYMYALLLLLIYSDTNPPQDLLRSLLFLGFTGWTSLRYRELAPILVYGSLLSQSRSWISW